MPVPIISADPIPAKKYRTVKEKVKLHPNAEVDKRSVDSLRKAGYDKVIGKPVKIPGKMDQYGPEQGDVIRKLLRK